MIMIRPDALSDLQIDALRELGSVGAGHAATALSQIVGTPVDISVPEARTVAVSEVPMIFDGPETLVGAVFSRLLGEVEGGLIFLAPRAALLVLVDLLRSRRP